MSSKHTPEPWTIAKEAYGYNSSQLKTIIWTARGPGHGVVAHTSPYGEPYEPQPSDAARIVACVNAMAGIEDPAAFVAEAKRLIEAAKNK